MLQKSITIVQDTDKAILVMREVANWLLESGKKPSFWWQPKNMNRSFMLKYAEADEFYVVLIKGRPAASAILQDNQRNQSWAVVDGKVSSKALYIHWLCVGRDFAGMNLAELLVDFAIKQALKRKINLLRLDTNAAESKLRNIYESLGFNLVGTERLEDFETAFYQRETVVKKQV